MKKLGVMLMVVVLTISMLAGCGQTSEKDSGSNGEKVSGNSVADGNDNNAKNNKPVKIRLMANMGTPENTLIGRNTLAMIEEKFNVELEIEVPPSANYAERLQLTFVSGDLPDAILFDNAKDTLLKDAASVGSIVPINTFIESAENIKAYTLESSWNAFKLLEDDQVFGIPRSSVVRADGFAIRKDWLDAIGIDLVEGEPITLEKFNEINRKFKTDDPDGNGVDDTYGLALSATPTGEMISLFGNSDVIGGAFGVLGWQKADGGSYEYMDMRLDKDTTKFKAYLQYLQDEYTAGYFDVEWPILKNNQLTTKFVQGKYGMMVTFPGHVKLRINKALELNPDAEMIYIPGIINEEYGKIVGGTMASGAWGGWAITKSAENPQLVIDILDYMLSDDFYYEQLLWGGEGVGFEMVDGQPSPLDPYMEKGEGIGWNGRFVRRAGDAQIFLNLSLSPEEKAKVQSHIDMAIASVMPSIGGDYVPNAALEPAYIDYSTTMNNTVTQIILGELSVDAYDEALAKWYEKGGSDYVEQMNAYIEKSLK